MDWPMIIERNAERLYAVVTELFVMAGFGRGGTAFLPRHVCRALLILLRPAKSAVRRLIIIAARGLVVKLRAVGASRAFPAGLVLQRDTLRVPAFCLIDPLKRLAPEGFEWAKDWGKEQVLPRISVPGLINPVFAATKPMTTEDDLVSPAAIRRRLQALREALDHLPREAMRLARWKARQAPKRIARLTPFRPGFAPGYHRHEPREIDAILCDCHYFAVEAWRAPDTS
jgi:hypothetical protein